jgi:uncharacterized repeat protein (TIGR03803 family)
MKTILIGLRRVNASDKSHFWRPLACALCLLASAAPAQNFQVLYTFGNGAIGESPAGLIAGTNGNFYGNAINGGSNDWGSIYQITTTGTTKPVYSFKDSFTTYDGTNPESPLVQGTNGHFYGMAEAGGTNDSGTIFQVAATGGFTPLYSFTELKQKGTTGLVTNSDGASPISALVLSTNGNFYGTTPLGGVNSYGTLFELTHAGKMTVLYSFSNSIDGGSPKAALLEFTNGYLYGTTTTGGTSDFGTVFQATAAGKVIPIYSFTNGLDGAAPEAALVNGHDGSLYGTCTEGGANGTGTIFKITTNGLLTSLYSFSPPMYFPDSVVFYNNDGGSPKTLLPGADGNFYGVAYDGGINGSGSIFEFNPTGGLTVLYAFNYSYDGLEADSDGANPISLLQTSDGSLYGIAYDGGTNTYGTFFLLGFPPQITLQPTNLSVALGANAAFTVAATGFTSCQWQFDNTNIPNATATNLSFTNVEIPDAGSYQVILTNLNGAVTSAVVTVTITNVPVSFAVGSGALQDSSGQFSLELTNLTGQGAIVIEASTDLVNWTPLYTNPPSFGALQFVDPNAGNFPNRFYRAILP